MEIGFIDYSHEERNKILSTLKLLDTQGALDELGIGTVRDAYSDILFPGISTLQTRAKYFVLIPYLFQSAYEETQKGRIKNGQQYLQWINEREDRLAGVLTEKYKTAGVEETGIIGSRAHQNKRTVKVKPSAIYWTGLRAFGIFRGGNMYLPAACRMMYAAAHRKAETELVKDGESFDDLTAADQGDSLFLPLRPDYDYENDTLMELTAKEAEFLSECILRSPYTAGSLLAFFVKNRIICENFQSVPEELLSESQRRDYRLAKDFARFIYGAHIRYNVIYSDYADTAMGNKYDAWRDEFLSEPFSLGPVLERVSCRKSVAAFCAAFLDAVEKNDTATLDDLIVRRELDIKRERAKLRKPQEYRYDPDHPVHDYKLEYRFGRASVIVRDVLKGLEDESDV